LTPLRAFYEASGGSHWVKNDGWLTGMPCNGTTANWWGVICDEHGTVVQLLSSYNGLTGTIAPELGAMPHLSQLWIQHSAFLSGTIPPALTGLGGLTDLVLNDNGLSGTIPPEFGQLGRLTSAVLDTNVISGTLAPQLGALGFLSYLGTNSNRVSGSIGSWLGKLRALNWLNLDSNALSGTLARDAFGPLSNLIWMDVYKNRLSGTIPAVIGSLPLTTNLRMHANRLSGTLPSSLGSLRPSYCYLTNWQCLADNAGDEICASPAALTVNQFACPLPLQLNSSACGGRGLNCTQMGQPMQLSAPHDVQ